MPDTESTLERVGEGEGAAQRVAGEADVDLFEAGPETKPAEKPAAEGEGAAVAVAEWNAEAFASENGLDPTLVRGKSEREALAALAKQVKDRDAGFGRQANELGELRKKVEAMEAARPAKAEPGPQNQFEQYLRFEATATAEQLDAWWQKNQDEHPAATARFMRELAKYEAKKDADAQLQTIRGETLAIRSQPLEAEFAKFRTAHAELSDEAVKAALLPVSRDLGIDLSTTQEVPLEDAYQLSVLKGTDKSAYYRIVGMMRDGSTFADAKKEVGVQQSGEAESRLNERLAAAAGTALAGRGGGASALGETPTFPKHRVRDVIAHFNE